MGFWWKKPKKIQVNGNINCTNGSDPWVRKFPGRRAWQPTPVFLPGGSPWMEEPGGLQSMGLQRVRHDWATKYHTQWIRRVNIVKMLTLSKANYRFNVSSAQLSHSVVSDSLWPHGLQHARPPCPSPTPGVYPNSCPLSQWCHPTISSSVVPFSSCLHSFPASRSI